MESQSGYDFWRSRLNCAQLVVAPMVDQSELPWRLLSRRYGAQLCYTPMFHARLFGGDAKYRRVSFTTCAEDRPLIVQFCANDPETMLTAAHLVEDQCDAVDLNLGCPQGIARRGHYGSFLQDEWKLIHNIVRLCATKLKVPITAKIRIFKDVNKTIEYAQMLEKAGCKLLTVHGRTREQKGPLSGLASWAQIKAVKDSVSIPVFANGNIQCFEDVWRCIKETGVDGVMTAEGNLHNPALFQAGDALPVWQLAKEYLELVASHPCPLSGVRAHLFKLLYHALHVHTDQRTALGSCKSIEEMAEIVRQVKDLSKADVDFYESECKVTEKCSDFIPYWICQPYMRSSADVVNKSVKTCCWHHCVEGATSADDEIVSRREQKKLKKNHHTSRLEDVKCSQCGNAKSIRCTNNLCKTCCKRCIATEISSSCQVHKRHKRDSDTEKTQSNVTDILSPIISCIDVVTPSITDGHLNDVRTYGHDHSEDNEERGKMSIVVSSSSSSHSEECTEVSLVDDSLR